jgi:sec-independent protein translocase protein TatB
MLDIGWGELFLIGIVALIVVGPKDLPGLFRTVGQFTGKARGMAREFQRSLEQAANETGVGEMNKSLRALDQSLNAATDSARKFARSPARTLAEEAMRKQGAGDDEAAAETGETAEAAPPPEPKKPARPAAKAKPVVVKKPAAKKKPAPAEPVADPVTEADEERAAGR